MSIAMAPGRGASSPPHLQLPDPSSLAGPDHRQFMKCLMSDVYALKDDLSGREWPPFDAVPGHSRQNQRFCRAGGIFKNFKHSNHEKVPIDHDLSDQSSVFCQAVEIGNLLGTTEDAVSPADAGFPVLVERNHDNPISARCWGAM